MTLCWKRELGLLYCPLLLYSGRRNCVLMVKPLYTKGSLTADLFRKTFELATKYDGRPSLSSGNEWLISVNMFHSTWRFPLPISAFYQCKDPHAGDKQPTLLTEWIHKIQPNPNKNLVTDGRQRSSEQPYKQWSMGILHVLLSCHQYSHFLETQEFRGRCGTQFPA